MATRLARAEDVAEIHAIYLTNRSVEDVVGVDYEKDDWAAFLSAPHTILIVAEEEGKVVGFLLGYDLRTWGYIDVLVVDHAARRKGIGSDLVKRFEGHGEARWGLVETCVDVRDMDTQAFAKKLDFAVRGKAVWYAKPLTPSK